MISFNLNLFENIKTAVNVQWNWECVTGEFSFKYVRIQSVHGPQSELKFIAKFSTIEKCALVCWCITLTTNIVREKKKKQVLKAKNLKYNIEIYNKSMPNISVLKLRELCGV